MVHTVRRAGVKLVEHLSFELKKGSSLLLTGHNGAGKVSLVVRIVGCIHPRTSKSITDLVLPLTSACLAGKSSIFRCLGGLWPIPHGSITKPGGAGSSMNSTIFYLPQKPYQVMGTF
jgi:ABC-type uncharacterized transport system fused permease/ATPase subunit